MAKTITQKVVFKNTPVSKLYSMYLDSKHHTAITGGEPANISAKEGAKYTAHGGWIVGKNLQLGKNNLIVQSWRGKDWEKGLPDSTFIMLFEQNGKDAVINMTHANIPDKHVAGIKSGWNDYYWKPWKKLLSK
jgi:activator of HSP90 ATPase